MRIRIPVAAVLVAGVAVAAPSLALAQYQLRPNGGVSASMGTHHPLAADGNRFQCFSLQTRKGERYQVTLLSEAFSPLLRVGKGRNCESLTSVIEDRQVEGERLADVSLVGDGTVWLVAAMAPSGGTGGFHVGINRTYTVHATPVPITVGQTLTSALTVDDALTTTYAAYDCYSFKASGGDELVITMRSSAFKPAVALYAAPDCQGTPVNFQNEFGEGEARLKESVSNTEVYSVRARSQRRDEFGAYSLTLQRQ